MIVSLALCACSTLDVFSNGSTSIDVTARNRESISYSGQMDIQVDK